MAICTFEFSRNSPLRTTLIDEATSCAKYQIDTPLRIVGSVTTIRKFVLPPQPPLVRRDKGSSDFGDDPTDRVKKRGFGRGLIGTPELPETGDEIARIHWKWFSPDGIDFLGKVTNRKEFLPSTGKMKG
jgi:hypothetical protein